MTKQEEIREVWVVESGEYEQRGIDGIFSSKTKAIEGIKAHYQSPYIVAWETAGTGLLGHFKEVPNYSTEHSCQFDIERWILNGK